MILLVKNKTSYNCVFKHAPSNQKNSREAQTFQVKGNYYIYSTSLELLLHHPKWSIIIEMFKSPEIIYRIIFPHMVLVKYPQKYI
jgi:hypothetical protein